MELDTDTEGGAEAAGRREEHQQEPQQVQQSRPQQERRPGRQRHQTGDHRLGPGHRQSRQETSRALSEDC